MNNLKELRKEAGQEWETSTPPNEVLVWILADDFMGSYTTKAMRKDYVRPKGSKKNVGWRWVDENGERLSRKYTPIFWKYIDTKKANPNE